MVVKAFTNRTATFLLLDTRSLNNKARHIYDIITERKLEFMSLTETWKNLSSIMRPSKTVSGTTKRLSLGQKPILSIGNKITQSCSSQLSTSFSALQMPLNPLLTSKFCGFFQQNADIILQQLHQTGTPSSPAWHLGDCNSTATAHPPQCCLSYFSPLDDNQIMELVSKAKVSSSKLDPMPSAW